MIRHVVLLELVEAATAEDRLAITDALATLPAQIPALLAYRFGTDLALAEGNADIAVVADFDDVAGYETYRDHPAHIRVIADYIKPVLARRTAVQFEV